MLRALFVRVLERPLSALLCCCGAVFVIGSAANESVWLLLCGGGLIAAGAWSFSQRDGA